MIFLISNNLSLFEDSSFIYANLSDGINILRKFDILALDTETEGLDAHTKKLLLLQIGNFDVQVLFDIKSFNYKIPPELKEFLNTHNCLYVLHNAKFDLKFLFKQDVILTRVFDTMLAEYIITNGLQYDGRDLATVAYKYCGVTLDKSVRGQIISLGLTTSVLYYGANDIKHLIFIKEKQLEQINKLNLLTALNLDNAFVIPLAYVEFVGIKLDLPKWLIKTSKNVEDLRSLKKDLDNYLYVDKKYKYFLGTKDMFTGEQECLVNWNSPKQVIKILEEYGVNTTEYVKGEAHKSIDAKVLDPQASKFPIVKLYLKYKEFQKEVSTYGNNWISYINPITNRIHTSFKQLNSTGRLSSGSKDENLPNIQNVPADKETRACFICEEDNVLIDADYSSQEQVILANFSREKNLIDFYSKGFTDMHSYIAFLMYDNIRTCTLEELKPEDLSILKANHPDKRQIAKSAGFAINYGGNGATIAKNCNISKNDGDYVYNAYFEAFPSMKQYFEYMFQKTASSGYITFNNVTNRKYFFNKEDNQFFLYKDEVESKFFWQLNPNAKIIFKNYEAAKSEIRRLSQNYPIQGSAADLTKYATVLFFKEILKNKWFNKVKIVNLVHDEILVESPEEIAEEVSKVLTNCMSEAAKPFCKVLPLKADAKIGKHWLH